jgi:sodium pump decarboxylase gamma subunit
MSPELLISLQITVIGMGLVFAALIVLWWLMEVLVRLSRDRGADETQAAGMDAPGFASEPASDPEVERRKRAALVAVALAISESEPPGAEFPIPPTASVSPWQAINRANMLNKRGLRS